MHEEVGMPVPNDRVAHLSQIKAEGVFGFLAGQERIHILEFELVSVQPLIHGWTHQVAVNKRADMREAARVFDNKQEHLDDLVQPEREEPIVVIQERVAKVDRTVIHNGVEVVVRIDHESHVELK